MAAITFPRAVSVRASSAVWTRLSFAALMAVTFVLYVWGLDRNGWANAYYAAAVQAGTKSWKAFFFGSLDASNFITVDKSPAFLWVMEISARLFGFNQWSVLVPQALEGVATVAIVYVAVRRWFGPAAGIIAGAVVTLTPVAALMFRYNNPDALLVLLLAAAAYATLRATENGSTRWLVLAAALIGTGFLAKMLQAFVIVPVVVVVYLVAGRPHLLQRVQQLVIAGVALIIASGWWVAIVQLWPSADRLYIGGSQDNNLLDLIFGYNGFGRLTGNETGSVGGIGAAGSRWGLTGWNRLFLTEFGGQISWLIPAAIILLGAGLWLTLHARRTNLPRASTVAALALVAALAGPAAFTLDTVATSHSGAIPSAGPATANAGFGPGGNGGGFAQPPGGGTFTPRQGGFAGGGPAGGGGNFLQASQVSTELAATLAADAGSYRWIVATIDANSAAGYELATGDAVMAIGGFNGSDPAPTLAQFEDYVGQGQIHYFIAGGMRGSGGGSSLARSTRTATTTRRCCHTSSITTRVGSRSTRPATSRTRRSITRRSLSPCARTARLAFQSGSRRTTESPTPSLPPRQASGRRRARRGAATTP